MERKLFGPVSEEMRNKIIFTVFKLKQMFIILYDSTLEQHFWLTEQIVGLTMWDPGLFSTCMCVSSPSTLELHPEVQLAPSRDGTCQIL